MFIRSLIVSLLSTLLSLPVWSANNHSDDSQKTQIAFAGGGWRALNAHAAWTMSLLDDGRRDLNTAFSGVDVISSNSGGSWFNAMLSFSNPFVASIERKDAIQKWSVDGFNALGWLGQQQTLFDNAPCHELSGDAFALCVAAYYTGSPINATYWHNIVENVVFKNHQTDALLSDPRQQWSEDKTLLFASSMLTSATVIGQKDLHQQYYQACLAPSKPVMSGNKGSSCTNQGSTAPIVTPVTFASVPNGSHYEAPPFFSAINKQQTHFNVGYSETALITPNENFTTLENTNKTEDIPVIVVASASSAAAGFGASKTVTGSWLESYLASDEPIGFKLADGLAHFNGNGLESEELAARKIVQIADGGAVDNSAVSQLIGFLQQNNHDKGFNIVAFDNVENTFKPDQGAEVGVDIANLFGQAIWQGDKICSGDNGSGTCITVPNLQIFELDALASTPTTWQAKAENDSNTQPHKLIYTKYRVTTIDNDVYGIKAGSSGTLHAFTAAWATASTSPTNATQNGDFEAYKNLVEFIKNGLQQKNEQGVTGIAYLEQALGL